MNVREIEERFRRKLIKIKLIKRKKKTSFEDCIPERLKVGEK